MTRWADSRGAVPIEFALGIGLLVFPVALLVLTLPTWSERTGAATAAAQEAARVVAVATPCGSGAARAEEVVEEVARNHGMDPARFHLRISGDARAGGRVEAAVDVEMPVTVIPGVGSFGAWSWTAHHGEMVDRYRSC